MKVEHPADVLCDRCPSGRAILATLAHNCTHCTVGRWSQGRKSVRTKQTSQIRLSVHPDPHQYLVTYDFQGGLTYAVNYYDQMSTYATNYYERKMPQSSTTQTMSDYCCYHHFCHCGTHHEQREVGNEPRSRLTSDLLWLIPCWPSGHVGRFANLWFLSHVKVKVAL